ncbi:tyrosine-type recombinase/integrase, partial [Escherichia coli]|uniref:tyrosine-type recombinase/integrase n=1 Tax=Escherichia coli TaxID=562 RepID=UPI0020403F45
RGKTSIFSHPVYLFLRKFSLQDSRGGSFHSFRHTVATQLKQHGVELAYAQAIMGHSSGSITYDRYAKEVEVDRLVNVMADVYKEVVAP